MDSEFIREQLRKKGLKITPQRLAIFEAVVSLKNHPTAEKIIEYIRINHPNISVGTVYKVLDSLTENDLLIKVKSEKDIMRYDALVAHHHHLYCADTDRIEDYEDPDLDKLINAYFEKKQIQDFNIRDIKLQITGTFKNKIK